MHVLFITLGFLFLTGLFADEFARRSHLPRVTLLVLCGVAFGPFGFDLLTVHFEYVYEFLSCFALTMVAFLLGGHLSMETLRAHGRDILYISVCVVVVSAVIVSGGLLLAGAPLALALLLGGIATATAPAATYDVIRQTGRAGPFVETLEGIVAIDDVWGLIVFSVLLSVALSLTGNGGDASVVAHAAREIFGALLVGGMVGVPGAYLTGRLEPGEPVKLEGLGLVFICAGLALWLDVSFLLAGMVAGAIIVNLASHHTRPFHEIEDFGWPFMMLFFLLAGASLEIEAFTGIGMIGAAYIALRGVSRWLGGWLGGRIAGTGAVERNWIGFALMPQAGVAIGMALVAGLQLPEYRDTIIAVTVGSTVAFELFGPFLTRMAIEKAAA